MAAVGFIGLGRMGRPMASNLGRKSFDLVVHDVNPEPVRALVAEGARAGGGAAEVASTCDIVLTMLPNSSIVEQVIGAATACWRTRGLPRSSST